MGSVMVTRVPGKIRERTEFDAALRISVPHKILLFLKFVIEIHNYLLKPVSMI